MNKPTRVDTLLKAIRSLTLRLIACFSMLVSSVIFAEDIELYISESAKESQSRPQVLIIFDNSGSMKTKQNFKKSYDPSQNYPALTGSTALTDDYIYYAKSSGGALDIPMPDSASENRRFLSAINGCKSARDILSVYGFYTGRVKEYDFQGNSGRWLEIPDNDGTNIDVIDCEGDVSSLINENAGIKNKDNSISSLGVGYPVDAKGDLENPQYHTADASDSNVSWTGPLVTLYTDNYLRWYQSSSIDTERKKRITVAKESISALIHSSPNVDFGLQVFNYNKYKNRQNGGRIVFGIKESTLSTRNDLVTLITDEISPYTWTPLCETLYEASRYFAGKSVWYGDDDNSAAPSRDLSVEESGVYKSPFSSCSDKLYVIMVTDGSPTVDKNANSLIHNIPATGQEVMGNPFNYSVSNNSNTSKLSMLPALADWLYTNDVNLSLDGKQTVVTYTIGFGDSISDGASTSSAEKLLTETANRGGGQYYFAEDSAALTAALTNVLANIEPSNDSLTSASVTANNFDKTQTLNSVYYAMFQPDSGTRWQGNVKKYRLDGGTQKGINGNAAVDGTGSFSDKTTSYWSSVQDGDIVGSGGVAEMLRSLRNSPEDQRTIYSDLGNGDTLVNFTLENAISAFGSSAELAKVLDVANDNDTLGEYLDWAKGINVDNEEPYSGSSGDAIPYMRPDVFGDPLHSKPVVINYGNNNIYILVGTNQGVLHFFKDEDPDSTTGEVSETWAFMPKDMFPKIKPLRQNYPTSDKIYGLDGRITTHIVDHNGNGVVDIDDSDEVWVFFGLRRGGSSYYALNLTLPNKPKKMWQIDAKGDFSALGQTWSQPKITYSQLNLSGSTAKPVLVFGGGYDINKDNSGTDDTVGKAVYIVDAEKGTLLWSTNSSLFTDSIPASIGLLDGSGNGLTDRLYFGDTGGNVWRVDIPGSSASDYSVFKLASLGGGGRHDRRFFNEPAIVRAYITETIDTGKTDEDSGEAILVKAEVPYDAVLIGSGDRTNPLGTDTDDVFYMIKDINIKTQIFSLSSSPPISTSAITPAQLYNYTDNPFSADMTTQEYDNLALRVSAKSGWYINFEQNGEKSSSTAMVINNTAYFTSFSPPQLGVHSTSCNIPSGRSWLYAVDLSLGLNKYNWLSENNEQSLNRDDRIKYINDQFLDKPTLIVTEHDHDNNPDTDTEQISGIITGNEVILGDFSPQTFRTYLTVDE